MKRQGKHLEKYYLEQYQKRQFPIEQRYPLTPDMRIVDGITPTGKKILVLGCSTGYDTSFLAKNNDVHGIDIMPQAVIEARRNGIKAIVWNIEDGLPYSDEEFDIVVCKEVLEHLINPEFAMSEIKRVLKKMDGHSSVSQIISGIGSD